MHRAISAFPNRIIYGGQLRDGPGTGVTLDAQMPGLSAVLTDIIANGASDLRIPIAKKRFLDNLTDDNLRRHYFEVFGQRVDYDRSMAVHEHIDVFMEKILPKLFDFFRGSGRRMRDEVMIICAYKYSVSTIIDIADVHC
jgi:hypothetical protein